MFLRSQWLPEVAEHEDGENWSTWPMRCGVPVPTDHLVNVCGIDDGEKCLTPVLSLAWRALFGDHAQLTLLTQRIHDWCFIA